MKTIKDRKIALVNGIIIDGKENMQPIYGKTVLISNGIIEDISDSPDTNGYTVIDLNGKYIMPGLINMHVHLAGNGKPQKKQRDNTKLVNLLMSNALTRKITETLIGKWAEVELMSGVTTVRTVGGIENYDMKIQDKVAAGKINGPRIITSGNGISVNGGHMAGSVAYPAKDAEDAVKRLEYNISHGVDFVKLMITGGVMDAKEKGVPGEIKMPADMIKAVCDAAHSKGIKVAAHVESPAGVKLALENGVDSIEHGAKPDDETIELFKKQNAFLCTTLSPALPYALFDRSISNASEVEQFNGNVVFEGIIECSKKAIENGIPVVLGNDVGCPYVSQYDFWRELNYFVKYVGVTNSFAIHTATLKSAAMLGIGNITGSVEKGKCADLVITEGNPLEDIKTLRTVYAVISGGKAFIQPKVKRKEEVDRELDKFL